jgi:hypothetical protein
MFVGREWIEPTTVNMICEWRRCCPNHVTEEEEEEEEVELFYVCIDYSFPVRNIESYYYNYNTVMKKKEAFFKKRILLVPFISFCCGYILTYGNTFST